MKIIIFIILITASKSLLALDIEISDLGCYEPKVGNGWSICDLRLPQNKIFTMKLTGEIIKGDYKKFLNEIKIRNSLPFNVYIKSPGGDANEAIKIGRVIRKAMIPTFIYEQCNSACFLIWAAGGERYTQGIFEVGLHRPRYDKEYFSSLSISEAEVEYEKLLTEITKYLKEMNIPEDVIKNMMATSSSEIYKIDAIKLRLKIGSETPVMNEWLNARCEIMSAEEMSDLGMVTLHEENNLEQDISDALNLKNIIADMSDGYIRYLKNKSDKLLICRNSSLLSARKDVIKEFLN